MQNQSENLTEKTSSEIFQEHTNFYIRQLGHFALESLNAGEPVRDEVIVHILAEKIRGLSNEHGWIIDGFPNTYNQAKLLEKALTGYNEDKPEPDKPKAESIIAPNPKPDPPKPKHQSGIDLVIYMDLTNDTALKRSIGRYVGTMSKKFYQLANNPPPEGAHSGVNKEELVEVFKDEFNEMEQIQHRLTAFEDEWSSIRKFYETYGHVNSVPIDNVEEKDLGDKIQNEIDLFEEMKENKRQEEVERLRMIEMLRLQKVQEEEEAAAKKKAEEEAEIVRKVRKKSLKLFK